MELTLFLIFLAANTRQFELFGQAVKREDLLLDKPGFRVMHLKKCQGNLYTLQKRESWLKKYLKK